MRRRDGSGAGIVGGLLAASLVIALLLAGQTQYAVRSHRKTVEGVLTSCSALSAAELVRRVANETGYQGYMRLLDALPALLPLPGGGVLGPVADPDVARVLPLIERAFVVEPAGPSFVGEAPPLAVTSWLAERIDARVTAAAQPLPYRVAGGVLEGRARLFVWSARPVPKRVGFEVSIDALGGVVTRALARGPLLPAALSHGRVGNGALSISVYDLAGKVRFHAGPATFANVARLPFGDTYGSVLTGFDAEVSIDPVVAANLVPGGLPPSRLPVLLALLGVSFALVVTAGLQVRRERDLSRLREAFVAGVSHELRTPLAQIRLYAETLLLGRTRSEEEERRALVVIDREARRLVNLVENVLTFSSAPQRVRRLQSRFATPMPRLHRAPVELGPLVTETVEGFRPLAAARGSTIALDVASGVRSHADAGAVSQIVLNLLDNAVKYGPTGQEIAVRLVAGGDAARLRIEDRGPGIAPRDRQRIFDRFTRLAREGAEAITGAGIGLAVVRELAEAHGGRVFVEDRAQPGACFVVELPLASQSGAAS